MGTKNNPGQFDCYGKLKPNEPYFLIAGHDLFGAVLTRLWAHARNQDSPALEAAFEELVSLSLNDRRDPHPAKTAEAIRCADAMSAYRTCLAHGHDKEVTFPGKTFIKARCRRCGADLSTDTGD